MRYALKIVEIGDGVQTSRHFTFGNPWIPVQMAWVNGSLLSAMDPGSPVSIQLDSEADSTHQSFYHQHPVSVTDFINLGVLAAGGANLDLTALQFSRGSYQFKCGANAAVLVLYYLECIQ